MHATFLGKMFTSLAVIPSLFVINCLQLCINSFHALGFPTLSSKYINYTMKAREIHTHKGVFQGWLSVLEKENSKKISYDALFSQVE